jgi:hypothetical protein
MRGEAGSDLAYAIAEKQLYASHYFQASLDLTFCIRDTSTPGQRGFYLLKIMGSEQEDHGIGASWADRIQGLYCPQTSEEPVSFGFEERACSREECVGACPRNITVIAVATEPMRQLGLRIARHENELPPGASVNMSFFAVDIMMMVFRSSGSLMEDLHVIHYNRHSRV